MTRHSKQNSDHQVSLHFFPSAKILPLRSSSARLLVCSVAILLGGGMSSSVIGQEKSSPRSSLNATDAELAGIISPADRDSAARKWEGQIAELELLDRTQPDPDDAVLLLGSSSIRLWEEAAEMLAPYPIIRRGYGGARFSDLVVFVKRLISPHEYRAVVVFVANDTTGLATDPTIDEIRKMVLHVISVSQQHQPDAPVLLVEVTPAPSRWKVWPVIRELNAMMREVALTHPGVSFISTAEYYLDSQDQSRPELFRKDQLHLNETGYRMWAEIIRRRLDEVLGAPSSVTKPSATGVSAVRVDTP